jgi:hypothetical protein
MDIIINLLYSDEKLKKIDKKDYEKRKDFIYNSIFKNIFQSVANSLLSKDLTIFCLKLVSIKLKTEERKLFDIIIRPTTIISTRLSKKFLKGLLR